MNPYSLRQSQPLTAVWLVASTAALGITVGAFSGLGPQGWPAVVLAWIVVALLLVVAGPFTVELDQRHISWRFGLLRWSGWKLPIEHIARVEVASIKASEGVGVRITSEGMLFGGGGLRCVRIHMKDGRKVRLGSPDPARLAAFIEARRR